MSKDIDNAVQLLAAAGVDCAALDDLVHDAKSSEASGINNAGMPEQVEYLLSVGFEPEEIVERLKG